MSLFKSVSSFFSPGDSDKGRKALVTWKSDVDQERVVSF